MIHRSFRTSLCAGIAVLVCALTPLFVPGNLGAQEVLAVPEGLPDWAFNIPDKVQPPGPKAEGIVRVKGSSKEYEAAKILGNANPPDWFPDAHPAAPRVVTGGQGTRFACGSCHLMTGQSHAEAADIAGMPAAYLIRQMENYRSGVRKDEARMGPIAKATSDEDVAQAAQYFASLKPRPWLKIVESANPPKTYIATAGRHRVLHPDGGTEAIGHRILAVTDDPVGTEIRDPNASFTAYVPPGSIARGEALVKTGAGKTMQCAICHGEDLKGKGEVPRLAGQHPLHIVRQLFSIRHGSSAAPAMAPMKPVVANLNEDDIIAISSYLATLPPA